MLVVKTDNFFEWTDSLNHLAANGVAIIAMNHPGESPQFTIEKVPAHRSVRPPDMRCGSCDQRLVPTKGRYVQVKPREGSKPYSRYAPNAWSGDYRHAGAMMDRHGAWPVEEWDG